MNDRAKSLLIVDDDTVYRQRLAQAMEKRGWKEARIRKVMGENWVRLLKEVWGA